eukprot:CAMPEP_0181237640 /NCGR_PEP_ID=MMETSP1096-20121128/38878_1 /TAXON_ID=156174 ORGANISM="Chrysochromulina ericina, Strain CCMP281" /NCGR_SAMPLE_ID=MMETSP1096 /ASSEMBLY_ACC=CAM_ASM_000453 /LENGTH=75 /DNA_ID=CAMNT_0023333023 /DNA_START=176 /DNA_END=399 /DNA_ORIENTATION=-
MHTQVGSTQGRRKKDGHTRYWPRYAPALRERAGERRPRATAGDSGCVVLPVTPFLRYGASAANAPSDPRLTSRCT